MRIGDGSGLQSSGASSPPAHAPSRKARPPEPRIGTTRPQTRGKPATEPASAAATERTPTAEAAALDRAPARAADAPVVRRVRNARPTAGAQLAEAVQRDPAAACDLHHKLYVGDTCPAFTLTEARGALSALVALDPLSVFFKIPLAPPATQAKLFEAARNLPCFAPFESFHELELIHTHADSALAPRALAGALAMLRRLGTDAFKNTMQRFWPFWIATASRDCQDFVLHCANPALQTALEDSKALSRLTQMSADVRNAIADDLQHDPSLIAGDGLALEAHVKEVMTTHIADGVPHDEVKDALTLVESMVHHAQTGLAALSFEHARLLVRYRDVLAKASSTRVRPLDIAFFRRTTDPASYLESFARSYNTLSTAAPEWERRTRIALDMTIKANRELRVSPNLLSHVEAELPHAIRDALQWYPAEIARASSRNRERSALFARYGGQTLFPEGSLRHGTKAAALPELLRTANLAGEATGNWIGNSDSFPGYVDLEVVDDEDRRRADGILSGPFARECALVYFPEDLAGAPLKRLGHDNHLGAVGAIPNTALGAIVVDSTETAAKAREALVESGLYVPVLHPTKGLVFTPDDFDAATRALKQFTTLDDLIASDDVYSDALKTTLDTDQRQTLAVHMNLAAQHSHDVCERLGIGEPLRTTAIAAAKLHDIGKLDGGAQEDTNVIAARAQLVKVAKLDPEQMRQILLLIRYDELLGEILQGMRPSDDGFTLTPHAVDKRIQLDRVFGGTPLKNALAVTYLADLQGKGVDLFNLWGVGPKLEWLGFETVVGSSVAAKAALS